MGSADGTLHPGSKPHFHEIRVEGHLDARWADRLQGLTFAHEGDGTTTLTGLLADQAALHGLLTQIRDLGVPIVSIRRIHPQGEEPNPVDTDHRRDKTS